MLSKFSLINAGVGAFLLINLEIVYGMNSTQDDQPSSNQTPTPLRLRNICLDNEEALFQQLDKLFLEQGLFNKIKHELKENGRLFNESINKLKSISLDDTNKSLSLIELKGSIAKTIKEIIKGLD